MSEGDGAEMTGRCSRRKIRPAAHSGDRIVVMQDSFRCGFNIGWKKNILMSCYCCCLLLWEERSCYCAALSYCCSHIVADGYSAEVEVAEAYGAVMLIFGVAVTALLLRKKPVRRKIMEEPFLGAVLTEREGRLAEGENGGEYLLVGSRRLAGKGLVVVREGISTPNAPYLSHGHQEQWRRVELTPTATGGAWNHAPPTMPETGGSALFSPPLLFPSGDLFLGLLHRFGFASFSFFGSVSPLPRPFSVMGGSC
ncbi:hypothetical protein NC651_000276 [Populus alba x Populus x berolinensis]|nr:hypothetical protein NC651_000276 [Populus alba x Populus x berolinensis]